ncbi:MAG: hypothetical protein AMK69_23435 [Nitrospira bacterium SG8_3]|nr:MAG: hypothetical protein AMK69_23435 [Nitrospira bacterium SG8_3]
MQRNTEVGLFTKSAMMTNHEKASARQSLMPGCWKGSSEPFRSLEVKSPAFGSKNIKASKDQANIND